MKEEEIEGFWICDEDQNVIIYCSNVDIDPFFQNAILEIFEKIKLRGPLTGEKLTELKITIEDLIIDNISQEDVFTELSTMLYEAIKNGLDEAELILLEPIYHTIIQLPPDYIKKTLALLSKYSAKIKSIDQDKEYQAIIEILLSVRNSLKFAEDIRNSSSGKAFWQNEFYAFMEVPKQDAQRLIQDLRFLKGLSW